MAEHQEMLKGIRSGITPGISKIYLPTNTEDCKALLGITPTEIFVLDMESGDAVGKVAGTTLTAVTPTFRYIYDNKYHVSYDSLHDKHWALNTLTNSTDSFIHVIRTKIVSDSSTLQGFVYNGDETASMCWAIYLFGQIAIRFFNVLIRDVGVNTVQMAFNNTIDWPALYTGEFTIGLQIDRAASTVRCRISEGGRVIQEISSSIAGFGVIDDDTCSFMYGIITLFGSNFGNAISYGLHAGGTQVEGADVLKNTFKRLGVE